VTAPGTPLDAPPGTPAAGYAPPAEARGSDGERGPLLVHTGAAPYMNPYLAGVGIGAVLLLAFAIVGRGLGASGAFSSVVTAAVTATAPEHAAASAYHAQYADSAGAGLLRDWLVIEIAGVVIGGFLSALVAGRVRRAVERGPRVGTNARLALALGGGLVMGVGAKLARGCTSGQALTGGALLSAGSWLFIAGAFAAAYLVAPLVRRQWR
jgi:uncharacterized membrane protein YedE/YeeE